jgi:hypothetical protein
VLWPGLGDVWLGSSEVVWTEGPRGSFRAGSLRAPTAPQKCRAHRTMSASLQSLVLGTGSLSLPQGLVRPDLSLSSWSQHILFAGEVEKGLILLRPGHPQCEPVWRNCKEIGTLECCFLSFQLWSPIAGHMCKVCTQQTLCPECGCSK